VKTATWGPLKLGLEGEQIVYDRAEGALTFRIVLAYDEERRTERTRTAGGTLAWGAKYRRRLAQPVALTLRLDLAGVHALAVRACRNKSGSAKDGPINVKGGKGARFLRVEGWTDEEAKG
jgi:hypothetical protein